MKFTCLSCFLFLVVALHGQQLEVVPRAGLQWVGLLTVHGPNGKPSDLNTTIPNLVVTIGADLIYKKNPFPM